MREMTHLQQAVAGALCILLMAGLGYGGSRVALGALDDDYRIEVVIGELGQGVVSGTDVKMRGVLVGSVGRTRLNEDLEAVVELVLRPEFQIPERARFSVGGKTLLGEKQVEILFDGAFDEGPFLAEGTLVDDPARVVEFEDILSTLAALFDAIDPDDLATVVDEFFGAFDGQGAVIARSIDQGAVAADTFAGSIDDQISSTEELSLVAESLGGVGEDFNRLGRAVEQGMPTISENQAEIARLLDELAAFSRTLDVTFRVIRPDLDRMIVQGDNVTRLLFNYSPELGQVIHGLILYTEKFGTGFSTPGIRGQAARFQIILDGEPLQQAICDGLPPELADQAPGCADGSGAHAAPDRDPHAADPPPLTLSLPDGITHPEVPERHGIDTLLRRAITPDGGDGS